MSETDWNEVDLTSLGHTCPICDKTLDTHVGVIEHVKAKHIEELLSVWLACAGEPEETPGYHGPTTRDRK